jgi:ComF family protein
MLTEGEEQICLSCLERLPRTLFYHRKDNPVSQHFSAILPIVHATAFFHYQKGNEMTLLSYSFKYGKNKRLAYLLGRQAALELELQHTAYESVDMLIPVPLHPKREKKRGYNQSEWICMGLSSVWNIPIQTDILLRCVQTQTQTNKTVYKRWSNTQNAFDLKNEEMLQGRHVLLVDDVITTGSTLVACTKTLLRVPDVRVSLFGLSIA